MTPSETLVFLVAVVGLTALTSGGVFLLLWLLWLRRLQRNVDRFQSSVLHRLGDHSSAAEPMSAMDEEEVVAQLKVAEGSKTVCVMERDGRRYLRVDGELTRRERDQVMRYLKSEGFMD